MVETKKKVKGANKIHQIQEQKRAIYELDFYTEGC